MKNYRGSSPAQEMKQGFDSWVRTLRTIEKASKESPNAHPDEQRKIEKVEFIPLESTSGHNSDEGH